MDPITQQVVLAAAGAAAAGEGLYVDDVFSTTLYTSNASSTGDGTEQVITTGIDHTEGFLTWIKNRDDAIDHVLFDSERIGTNYKWLYSNSSSAEQDTANIFKNPTSTGFTVRQDTSGSGVGRTNPSGAKDMCAWNFRKAPGFFDIVTYVGNGTSGRTVSHNLGSTPGMIIIKSTDASFDWVVWHRNVSTALQLNSNLGSGSVGAKVTAVSSSDFTLNDVWGANKDGTNFVAYIFAHDDQSFGTNGDEAIIKCGSYTGTGSAYNEIDLGFEPQFILFKNASNSVSWYLMDTMRGLTADGSLDEYLFANENYAAGSATFMYPTATGFGFTATGPGANASGDTYIYMAIRRPNKPPEAATDVFAIDTSDATSPSPPQFTSGFVTDFVIRKTMDTSNATIGSRLQGIYYMSPYSTTKEDRINPPTALTWDFMDGWSNSSGVDTDLFAYMFKRAPGFMDVIGYVGTGAVRTLDHNLGAVPELVICKNREFNLNWATYTEALGRTKYLSFGDTGAATTTAAGTFWGNSDFTSTQISLGTYANTNYNNLDMIAYLFASLDGISKIGTYSGTGSNIDVDCGFTAGARFVMIKRTDTEISGSTGTHWYIWDTTNGIVSGNDPYWKASEAVAAVTNTDYIDPLNAGFTVNSSAPAALNTSGGTYMFLAIA